MFSEEIRLARSTQSFVASIVVSSAPILIIPANPQRWSILFLPSAIANARVMPISNPNVLIGMQITATMEPKRFDLLTAGDIVRREWYGIAEGADTTLIFVLTTVFEPVGVGNYGRTS